MRHCSVENRKKKLTEKTPSKKENNKLRKFKVLRHGNTGDKLASQKPAKTVTPAFSFDFTKCGQVSTSNVVYLRAVKVGYGIKIFVPGPLNDVARSPGSNRAARAAITLEQGKRKHFYFRLEKKQ